VTIRDGKVDIALPTTRSPRSRVAASLMLRMWPGSPIRVGVEKRILPALLTRRRQPFVHEVDQQIGREAMRGQDRLRIGTPGAGRPHTAMAHPSASPALLPVRPGVRCARRYVFLLMGRCVSTTPEFLNQPVSPIGRL
jgi:hypothetical protein